MTEHALLWPSLALLPFPAVFSICPACVLEHIGSREVVGLGVELALVAEPFTLGNARERRGEAA